MTTDVRFLRYFPDLAGSRVNRTKKCHLEDAGQERRGELWGNAVDGGVADQAVLEEEGYEKQTAVRDDGPEVPRTGSQRIPSDFDAVTLRSGQP